MAPQATNTYTTAQSDTWDLITRKVYGKYREVDLHHLMAANPEHREIKFFSANVELAVPKMDPNRELSAPPPWKKRK